MPDKRLHNLDAAIYELASLMPSGHLQATTDPVGFLGDVACELSRLRAANSRMLQALQEAIVYAKLESRCNSTAGRICPTMAAGPGSPNASARPWPSTSRRS